MSSLHWGGYGYSLTQALEWILSTCQSKLFTVIPFHLLIRSIFLSVIYGANTIAERRMLSQELTMIKSQMEAAPWIICGDFNTELCMSKRSDYFDGTPISQSSLDFRKRVEDLELSDLHCDGSFLTWSHKRASGFLAKKLDIFLINNCWMDAFSDFPLTFQTTVQEFFQQLIFRGSLGTLNSLITSLSIEVSCLLFLSNGPQTCFMVQRYFSFASNFKLKKLALRSLNKMHYSGIQERIALAHDRLLLLQLDALNSHASFSHETVAEQEAVLSELIVIEEAFLRQKSRVRWLNKSDQNSKYFHRVIKGRQEKMKISAI